MTDADPPNVEVSDLPESGGVAMRVGGSPNGLEFFPLVAIIWVLILI